MGDSWASSTHPRRILQVVSVALENSKGKFLKEDDAINSLFKGEFYDESFEEAGTLYMPLAKI